jgi:hypothetical protein
VLLVVANHYPLSRCNQATADRFKQQVRTVSLLKLDVRLLRNSAAVGVPQRLMEMLPGAKRLMAAFSCSSNCSILQAKKPRQQRMIMKQDVATRKAADGCIQLLLKLLNPARLEATATENNVEARCCQAQAADGGIQLLFKLLDPARPQAAAMANASFKPSLVIGIPTATRQLLCGWHRVILSPLQGLCADALHCFKQANAHITLYA